VSGRSGEPQRARGAKAGATQKPDPESLAVPATLAGERVDRAVALLTGWSRAEVQALIDDGAVRVDGRTVVKSRRLEEGDVVELLDEPAAAGLPVAQPIPITVVAEDPAFVVVDNPACLVVHPGAGHADGTLVNGLLHRYPEIAGVGDPARPGIVHRLDRDTSGLMVVARTPGAYEALVGALAARTVERGYLALVRGVPSAASGMIDAPIGRSVRRPTRMAVREGGREARTRYEVLRRFRDPDVSLLRCTLETGRTHQIRVHLAAIHHPVVGDPAYGGSATPISIDRPFLHAATLAFDHPVTGEPQRFASELPPDLQQVLEGLSG
jgi:23S rRNA pseudouridine1911/1915/1917 synthase